MDNASHTDQTNPGELRFRKLIEHSYAGITLLDHELKVVYRSPSAERITGWSLINRTGQAVTSLVHPDDALVLHQILLRVYAQPGEPVTTRFRTRHYAGHYITIDCTLTNLLDEPEVEAIVFNFVDVTKQVQREAQQQQSRKAESEASQTSAKLEGILDSITDGFFTADADQRYTYVNKRLCQMVGLTAQEMIGRQVWDVFPDAVGSTTYDSIQEALHEKHFVRSEDYYAPLDLWQENRVYPGADGFSMFIQDITNRKKADEQLRLLFDRAPDMIGILGLDRYFKRVNPAMCSQLEYAEKQLLDTSLDHLVHPDDVEVSRDRTEAFIASDNQTMYFENRFLTKSGKAIWLSWTVTRSANEKQLFCVGKDISDKKEIENLLHKANQLARIGSWEVDRVNGTAYWSPITREIYEVPESFVPSANNWLSFYRQGADRDYIAGKMANTIATGKPCDAEVVLVTALGNLRWVRAMAEAEFRDGECVRVYGSFQDIDQRKRAELAATAALAERNAILESIGDGFFAVDSNWIVTYWNATAEKNTGKPRETMLGKYFWDIYKDVLDLEFYRS